MKSPASKKAEIFQVRIELLDYKPTVWRSLQVPASLTLGGVHDVIQVFLEWDNSHLHAFYVGAKKLLYEPDYETTQRVGPDWGIQLDEVLKTKRSKLLYEYDFGDRWEHRITLEAKLPKAPGVRYPVCVGGENSCPPEDSGGTFGFPRYLAIARNPEHPNHAHFAEWFRDFDPAHFSVEEANALWERRGCWTE